jgi:hypothetical protein
MPSAGHAFLTGILDYAGLFPPAQLPMNEAWARFSRDRTTTDGWILGRFLCPGKQLAELASLVPSSATPVAVGVVGTGGTDPTNFYQSVREDGAAIAAFHQAVEGKGTVTGYEVKLPEKVFDPPRKNQIAALVSTAGFLLAQAGCPALPIFVECPRQELSAWIALLEVLIEERRGGIKIRCGGTAAAAIPSSDSLAKLMHVLGSFAVPFKATAGLHHAYRHHDAAVAADVHGFVNVFAAGLFARYARLSPAELEALIVETHPLAFEDDAIHWRAHRVSVAQIEEGRSQFTAFGSCSFDEPAADVKKWILPG